MRLLIFTLAALVCAAGHSAESNREPQRIARPNVIVIVADDLGIGDLSHNGSIIRTPHVDALAAGGTAFSNFYASANVCSPSRAGLLTGRYPIRMGLAHKVVEAGSNSGMPKQEITLAEELSALGYATALVGKWHLGDREQFWPTAHGFDQFFGLLHSNDMRPLVLYENKTVVEEPVDQTTLTQRYTKFSLTFIKQQSDRPFLLYLGHSFPHFPLHASDDFLGKSKAGIYGDAVEEIDWSVGAILRELERSGKIGNTLVVFTSDNGAWFEGSNSSLRDGKGHTFDGGYRVPMIVSWPGQVPKGKTVDAIGMNIDLLPTVMAAPGISKAPANPNIDGESLWPILRGENIDSSRALLLFNNEDVAGIRTQRWKYLVRAYYRDNYAAFDRFEQGFGFAYPLLYDMASEHPERYSVASRFPDEAEKLLAKIELARETFADLRTQPPYKVVP